ncbi:MAG TPA: aminomethyl-transferring glycine dehydrogenase subunit GcvPB, partial [Acidimicrobiales bacterium]
MTRRALSGGRAASAPLLGHETEPTIFEMSVSGRSAYQLRTTGVPATALATLIPAAHLNGEVIDVAEVSERDLVGHFTRLSHRQFSVDLGMYPLGSCTMKYNPKFCDAVANDPGLNTVHPGAPAELTQGWLEILATLEEKLCAITGMTAATLQPAAGAAGELTGLLLMRAYHSANGDARRRVLIPDSAHGTNPASVTLGGYEVTT